MCWTRKTIKTEGSSQAAGLMLPQPPGNTRMVDLNTMYLSVVTHTTIV